MRHKCQLEIRWADLDAFKHINNAAYLVYMQEARADFTWFSRIAKGEEPLLADMVVARAEVDYLSPIHQTGTTLEVEIYIEKVSNSSFVMVYEMSQGGTLRARGKTVQVGVDMETEKARRLRDNEREFLNQYLEGN
ncbi:MAG: acyl-CoA thioesterase [Candidatus Nanopelagicaceae bacterium]|jgi:acyl-CoA thioester hydrolase|nr:acyl-CoA thioesterase [Candidatus Nanopelagicaceae bacterium]